MNIKKYTQEEFLKSSEFDKCNLIYSKKYPLENGIELEGYSNLSFYIYEIENEIIGYGSYQINDMMYIVETIFTDEYKYKNEHISFLNYLLNIIKEEQINDNTIFSYQSMEEDLNFYINNGFKLYKDYGAFFESGYDNTRYILEYDFKI